MIMFVTIIFFVFGLVIGSFLNVVILRLNTQKSFGGRSACMSCDNKLCWYELIPFFSFFALRGRCRNCKTKISLQYPLVEFITGFVFLFFFLKFKDVFYADTFVFFVTYAYYAVAFMLLIIIAAYDLKHKIIPDALSLIFGVLAFVGLFFFSSAIPHGFFPHLPSLIEFLSGLFIALPFALLWLVSGGAWMGLGDAKLSLGLGWFLGPSFAFSAMVLAFWIGAIVGLCLIVFKKQTMKSEIPFAPYLILGALLVFIFQLNFFNFGFFN